MIRLITHFLCILCSNVALGALHVRDLDGNFANGHEGVYDDVLDITWLARAQVPEEFSGSNSNFNPSFLQSMNIIDLMNTSNYFGFSSWRLPKITPANGESYNLNYYFDGEGDAGYNHGAPVSIYNPYGVSAGSTDNELAYQYYVNLGGISQVYGSSTTQYGFNPENLYGIDSASNLTNLALFSEIDSFVYWMFGIEQNDPQAYWSPLSGEGYISAWKFAMQRGATSLPAVNPTEASLGADFWAVHDGDIGTAIIPLPTAILLFSSGLAAIMATGKIRFKTTS